MDGGSSGADNKGIATRCNDARKHVLQNCRTLVKSKAVDIEPHSAEDTHMLSPGWEDMVTHMFQDALDASTCTRAAPVRGSGASASASTKG
jgi:predicted outer membrane protein